MNNYSIHDHLRFSENYWGYDWWLEMISNDIVILILPKINRRKINHYILRNYLSIFYWSIILMIMTSLLWQLDYILDNTNTTCMTLHLSIDLPSLTQSRNYNIHCIHYLVLTSLTPTCDHVTLSYTLSYTCID